MYHATLLNSFIWTVVCVYVESVGFSRHNIVSSASRDNFMFSFILWLFYYLFIYLFCLTDLARNCSTALIKTGESGNPCLQPDLKGEALSFSPLSIDINFSYKSFIMLRCVISITSFSRAFIMRNVKLCQILFPHLLGSAEAGRILESMTEKAYSVFKRLLLEISILTILLGSTQRKLKTQ